MDAPTFVGASTGATDATGAWAYTITHTGTVDNVIILQVLQDGTTAAAIGATFDANAKNLAGTTSAMTSIGEFAGSSCRQYLWIGRIATGSSIAVTGTNSTAEDVYVRAYEFTDVSQGTTLAEVIENSTAGTATGASGSGTTVSDTGVITLSYQRLALNLIALNDDVAVGILSSNNAGGGLWREATPEYADAGGTDGCLSLQTCYMAGVNSYGASATGASTPMMGESGTTERVAQSFATSGVATITALGVHFDPSVGTPTNPVVLELQSNSGGQPSGTVLTTSAEIAADLVSDNFVVLPVTEYAASASTTYWIVVRSVGARDASNYVTIRHGTTNTASGQLAIRNSGTWDLTNTNDLWFSVHTMNLELGATQNVGQATLSGAAGWSNVGFALLPDTGGGAGPTYEPRYGYINHANPGVL